MHAFGKLRSTGELSDLTVQIGDRRLDLHRFPLVARSNYFRCLQRSGMSDNTHVTLDGFPGGSATMELIADFCYNVPIWDRLDASNVGHALCASSYLQMTGPNNLTEKCRSCVETLTNLGVSTCLDILINCLDVKRAADHESLTKQCTDAAVRHWLQIHDSFPLSTHADSRRWMSQIRQLPVDWVTKLLDAIQTGSCHVVLTAHVASNYLTFIMERFTNSIQHRKDDTEIASCPPNDCQMVSKSEQNSTKIGSLAPVSDSGGQLKSSFVLNTDSQQDLESVQDSEEGECKVQLSQSISSQVTSSLSGLSLEDMGASLQAFDVVTSYIPEDHAIYKVVPASWFATALRFASEHDALQNSTQRLTSLCAPVYDQLKLEDIQDMQPIVLSRLNDSTRNKGEGLQLHVLKLTDQYLFQRASLGSIEPFHFALLLNLQYRSLRESYDQVFEALELVIGSRSMSDTDVHNILQYMDFTKLSQAALERAASNERIPQDSILKAALAVCSRLRERVAFELRERVTFEDDRQKEIAALKKGLKASLERPRNHLGGHWITKSPQYSPKGLGYYYADRQTRTADLPDSEIVMKITPGEVLTTSTSLIDRKRQPHFVAIDDQSTKSAALSIAKYVYTAVPQRETRLDCQDQMQLDENIEANLNSSEGEFVVEVSRKPTTTAITRSQYGRTVPSKRRETSYYDVQETSQIFRTSSGYFMPLCVEKRPPTGSASSFSSSLEERPPKGEFPTYLVYDMSSDCLYTGKWVQMTRWERKA